MFDIKLFKALRDTERELYNLVCKYTSAIEDELAWGDADEVRRLCTCRDAVENMHLTIFKERVKMEETFE